MIKGIGFPSFGALVVGNERRVRLPYPKDAAGNPLCRWCRGPVTPPRKSWCGDACVDEYRLRYDSTYQRRIVLKRDKGVCAGCGLDCLELARLVVRTHREVGYEEAVQKLIDAGLRSTDLRWKGWRKDRLHPLWQADHIVPVVEGGGGTTVENLRTLCSACHRKVTADLMVRRRAAKKRQPA
ncbi:MAG: HNH endonuclease [Proteobacteria bacterium]|nr:HNH endonuclease [Pseudomonadota bacterium]